MSYILPQVQVFQMFNVLPTSTVRHLNAFVFGPNYKLFRYADAAEKEQISLGAYDKSNDTEYAYPAQPDGSIVDQGYAQLYMENIWAKYLAISASAANPLNVVSNSEMNKLRAAPIIGTPMSNDSTNVRITTAGGTYDGDVVTPETYVIAPYGGRNDSNVYDVNYGTTVLASYDGVYRYCSSNGVTGTFDVTDVGDVQGPKGIIVGVVAGAGKMFAPLHIKIDDGSGNYFIMSIDWNHLVDFTNWALDSGTPLRVNVTIGSGSDTVAWAPTTKILTIVANGYTLAELKDALEADADVAEYFTVSDITGVDSGTVANAKTIAAIADIVDLDGAGNVVMIPNVARIRVSPNPYVFKTANGTNHSSHFKSRDVQVGDRLTYSIVDGSTVTHTGSTKIVALEADTTIPVVEDATQKTTNTATQVGSDLSGTGAALVEPGVDNYRPMNGTNTAVIALSDTYFPGELAVGIIEDTYTVTIVTKGVAGVALADVSNASGTYIRNNVMIEAVGSDDGQIYVGRNMTINFEAGSGDADAEFQVGDTYSFTVKAPFTKLVSQQFVSGGTYDGPVNTTYMVEVVRGGVFTRNVSAIPGLSVPAVPPVLVPSVDWANWTGGDIDDEYVLKCTTAGAYDVAEFELTSQTGDNAEGIIFGVDGLPVAIGNKGLSAIMVLDSLPVTDEASVGDYWIIKVNAARPQVRIYDTAGIDSGSHTIVADATALELGNYGAELTFAVNGNTEGGFAPDGGLMMGDLYMVNAAAANEGAVRTLVLADDMPSAITPSTTDGVYAKTPSRAAVNLFILQASNTITSEKVQSPPDYNWETSDTEVTVYGGIAVQDSSWYDTDNSHPYLPVEAADMYIQYRALLSTYADTIREMTDIGDVAVTLGTITPENPLAQGVYNALSNSGDRSVFYIAVPTDDLAGYTSCLDKASLTANVYGFAPLTKDRSILDAVEAHIVDMSSEENKRWRYGFFGTEMPTEVSVYDLLKNPAHEEYFATITENPSVTGSYTIVKFYDSEGDPSPYTNVMADVKVGDKIRIKFATDAWGNATYDEYVVKSLLTNTSLKLVSGPASALTPATKVEVWHDYSVAEMANAVAAVSTSFANRRIAHVFPSELGAFGVIQSAEFAAAAVAGLNSSVAPQQGLTNIELNGFDDLPMVYSTFNRSQLNTMAGAGTLIIMQDVAGGKIYIRHQVTTAASEGNLNTTELSITKNLDSISYYFADRLAPFIGQFNVTPDLIEVLRAQVQDGLHYLGAFTSVGLLGPQLILDGTNIERLEQHPTLRDHIVAVVNVQLPYPLNVLQLYLVV